ncbi:MAG: hypothetical protein HY360_25490 [Verrucomicrobia bacterium]|nr:hypothetical protein [Verrucomicrobiota bacterium]
MMNIAKRQQFVKQLVRDKTKVAVEWLAEQLGLKTCGGMRYSIHRTKQRL